MADPLRVGITGLAIRSGLACTPEAFAALLRAGTPGLRLDGPDPRAALAALHPTIARGASRPFAISVLVALEALAMAGINGPACAVVVAGSNLAQAATHAAGDKHRAQPHYTPVRHGYELFDTHVASAIAEAAGLHGPGLSVGAASASGNAAIIVAADMVALRRASACLVVAPPSGFSPVEWQSLDAMGALLPPGQPCRPFDTRAAGFAPAEACAAVVIEPLEGRAGVPVLAEIAGSGMVMHAARGTAPDDAGEAQAMRLALGALPPAALGLVSAHATGTPAGDAAEARAIAAVLGPAARHVPVNAPKSLIGHPIQAAALVELVALILQMRDGFLHGTANLEHPITTELLLPKGTLDCDTEWALNNAFGFGGLNTGVLLRNGRAL